MGSIVKRHSLHKSNNAVARANTMRETGKRSNSSLRASSTSPTRTMTEFVRSQLVYSENLSVITKIRTISRSKLAIESEIRGKMVDGKSKWKVAVILQF